MLNKAREAVARWIAPPATPPGAPPEAPTQKRRDTRMYANARNGRLSADWRTATSSADSELYASLTVLRNRSRSLVRDNGYAKRARNIVVNNVIGTGIGLQAQVKSTRGDLNQRVNTGIETAWASWSRALYCHTGGKMHFCDLERAAMAQVFESGEVLLRDHYRPFGGSPIPFALEFIEAERIAGDFANPPNPDLIARMGIEVDRFDRPQFYWISERHPNELRTTIGATNRIERVPAELIHHLHIIDRWPQARGEPWLHATISRLKDIDGYSEAEIVAARAAACYMGFIKSPEDPAGDTTAGGQIQREFQPGMIDHLGPGEDFIDHSPNRPNPAMEAFMRALLREVAAGIGVSYESLSRDYSQSNYSSSRLALLDDRELWRTLQGWFIRTFRAELHRRWLQQAVLAGAIPEISVAEYVANPEKFEAARWKPRGWGWIDPTKEVEAYKNAVRCGFITVADVISATGGGQDLEDVLEGRRLELDMMAEKNLTFDTDPTADTLSAVPAPPKATALEEPDENTEHDENAGKPRRVIAFSRTLEY